MKKLGFLLLLLVIPFTFVKADDNFNLIAEDSAKLETEVNGSSVTAGANNATTTGTVKGINMVFGNNVDHRSVSDYAILAGNSLKVTGNILNDGFVMGNVINFDKDFKINRDLVILGNAVSLKGNVTRDVTIFASSVNISEAKISGNVTIKATSITIEDDVVISGKLTYNEDAKQNISNEADIITVEKTEKLTTIDFGTKVKTFIISYLSTLALFAILALVVPALFKRIKTKNKNIKLSDLISNLGYGAIFLIIIPILFAVLLCTIIGIQVAIFAIIAYVVIIWLSLLIFGYLIGNIIWEKYIKKDENILLEGLVGISIIEIVSIIPYVGGIIIFIALLMGIGTTLKLFSKN